VIVVEVKMSLTDKLIITFFIVIIALGLGTIGIGIEFLLGVIVDGVSNECN